MAEIIRAMRTVDVDEVYGIELASFSSPWTRQMIESEVLHPQTVYLVLEIDSKVVAYGGYWCVVDEAHITNLAVRKDMRRRGLGQKMLQALMDSAIEKGLTRMTLEVRESNITAQQLYVKMGFVHSGIRPHYYEDNDEDAVIMWLDGIK